MTSSYAFLNGMLFSIYVVGAVAMTIAFYKDETKEFSFIVKIVTIIGWPIVVPICLYMYRRQKLKRMIHDI